MTVEREREKADPNVDMVREVKRSPRETTHKLHPTLGDAVDFFFFLFPVLYSYTLVLLLFL